MNIYIPFTYIIGWSEHKKFYYGKRTAKNCNPDEFWVSYFTSSKYVKNFRKEYGEPDIIRIHKKFPNDPKTCSLFEESYLRRIDAKNKENFLNKHNGGKKFDTTGVSQSEQTKQKISNGNSKEYICVSPENELFEIKNLSKFCTNYKLTEPAMRSVANGRTNYHKMWQCFHKEKYNGHKHIKTILKEMKEKRRIETSKSKEKCYTIFFPDGRELEILNLTKFCNQHNLCIGLMVAVAKGERPHHKNYKCFYM